MGPVILKQVKVVSVGLYNAPATIQELNIVPLGLYNGPTPF